MPEGAESCLWTSALRLRCQLRKDEKWSDGKQVLAADYVRSFRRLLAKSSKSPSVELLKNVKNALAVNSGTMSADQLGLRATSEFVLEFEFAKADPDFLYKLTASVLAPVRTERFPGKGELSGVVFNGPYRVVLWVPRHRIRLEKNPYYKRGNPNRPPVEFVFVDDDQTAVQLYEQKQLSFLRRLPATFFSQYRNQPDFHQIPVSRFDYLGFGEDLKGEPDLRDALSSSLDFYEMKKLFDASGLPGCAGLPDRLLDHARCVKFDLAHAKESVAKVRPEVRARAYKLLFSRFAGDDVKHWAEFLQAQWKKNLGIHVELEQMDFVSFLHQLQSRPPAIFRKGIGLESPTCLSALETFATGGSENFLKIAEPDFEAILDRLRRETKTDKSGFLERPSTGSQKACGDGVQFLIDRHLLVPLGAMHFTVLADPRFKGWSLNEMNQLDLSSLTH